jgi:16S rRNA (guanine527-N7)-methyltransferase
MRAPQALLANGAAAVLGRQLTLEERDHFDKYLNLLVRWQRSHRLVGSADPMWIVEHLFLDSLLFLRLLPVGTRSIVDLGSGAGLPGVPIKIVRSEVEVTLIESRRRRASFLSAAVRELGLRGVHVIADRAEDRLSELEGRFDAVVMRCTGDLDEMIPFAAKLLARPEGLVICAGPPEPRPLLQGEWVEAPGVKPRTTRRFAVYRKGQPARPS